METVEGVIILLHDGQSHLLQILPLIALVLSQSGISVPFIQRIAQLELTDGILMEATVGELSHTDRLALLRLEEVMGEMLLCPLGHRHHALPFGALLDLLLGQFLLLDIDVVFLGEEFQRLVVREVFQLHDKVDRVTTLAATEALVNILGGRDREGRRFFIVERTETGIVSPASMKCDIIRHHIDDLSRIKNPINRSLVYHRPLICQKKEA